MKNTNIGWRAHTDKIAELHETRSVDEANDFLRLGWQLLEIGKNWRGPLYILGACVAHEIGDQATLPAHNNNNQDQP